MNILIEDAAKMEYLTNSGNWSKNVAKGKAFESTHLAFETAKQEPIGEFNIVSYITANRQFVNLDSGKGKGAGSAD